MAREVGMSGDIFDAKPFDQGRSRAGYDTFHRKPFDPQQGVNSGTPIESEKDDQKPELLPDYVKTCPYTGRIEIK